MKPDGITLENPRDADADGDDGRGNESEDIWSNCPLASMSLRSFVEKDGNSIHATTISREQYFQPHSAAQEDSRYAKR